MSGSEERLFYEWTDDGAALIARFPELREPAWRFWVCHDNLAWMRLLAAETSLLKQIEEVYGESAFGTRVGLEATAQECEAQVMDLLTRGGEPMERIERFLHQLRELGQDMAGWRWKEETEEAPT